MPVVIAIVAIAVILLLVSRRSTAFRHSDAYIAYMRSPAWRERSRRCMRWTHGRCALFFWLPAVEAHHLHYRNLFHERIWRDILPLSAAGHRWAHAWILWSGPLRGLATAFIRMAGLATAIAVRPIVLCLTASLVAALVIAALATAPQWRPVVASVQDDVAHLLRRFPLPTPSTAR